MHWAELRHIRYGFVEMHEITTNEDAWTSAPNANNPKYKLRQK